MRNFVLCLLTVLMTKNHAYANEGKDFMMSATYGLIAGTLVGTATLGLTENPGDHLQNIAKGASLGLYFGILLGAYIVYWAPEEGEEYSLKSKPFSTPSLVLSPIYSQKGIDGLSVSWQAYRF